MFYYICGQVTYTDINCAVIEACGVGYKLTVSSTTLGKIANSSGNIRLYTHLAVREDGVELFGFYDTEELSLFKLLISVSGVGPKAAMSILSSFSPAKFAIAVGSDDVKALSTANGIGAKTAARIILELKDKVAKQISTERASLSDIRSAGSASALSDAQNALLVLGYTKAEAVHALNSFDSSSMELEDIIKEALKRLMK